MAVRQIKLRGRKIWQARVQFKGKRASRLCASRDEARQAEADLLREIGAETEREQAEGAAPATLRMLFEFYAADLEARGKGADTIIRAKQTEQVMAAVTPELLDLAVSKVGDKEVFAFRAARVAMKAKPSTINRDLRTLRAMLKKARPDFRFPGGAFFREDETRVRWLRPEEEVLVFATMPSPFQEIAKLAALTLMRLTEIRLLRREQLHLEQGLSSCRR